MINSPIKVLHVTFDMTIGGAQQVIRQLIQNIDHSLVNFEIVCIDNVIGELGESLQEEGIRIHSLRRQDGFDFFLIKELNKIIIDGRFHIVHCHQYSPYVYGLFASFFTSSKVIFTEHGRFYPDYGTWKRKAINPILNIFTAKITSISQATKNALVSFENFSADSIELLYNGIADMSKIFVDEKALKSEFLIPESKFIFGTISRLQPIKNQKMMIRAFKEITYKVNDAYLIIVGDGEIREELEELVEELNLASYVTFTGFQKEPYRFHYIIDVFLLPSFSEGASMTLLEAMSFSKPCVVTKVGGNTEIIDDNLNGLVVESDNQKEFSSACIKLFKDENLYQNISKEARKKFLSHFTLDKMSNRFQELYIKVLN